MLLEVPHSYLSYCFFQILSEGRKQTRHVAAPSKNERQRKETVDRINRDNKAIVNRLETMAPIIKSDKFEADFSRHLNFRQNLSRRRKLFQAIAGLGPKKHPMNAPHSSSSSPVQKGRVYEESPEEMDISNSAFSNIAEFRAHVISKKKMEGNKSSASIQREGDADTLFTSNGRNKLNNFLSHFENISSTSMTTMNDMNMVRFELSHSPTTRK